MNLYMVLDEEGNVIDRNLTYEEALIYDECTEYNYSILPTLSIKFVSKNNGRGGRSKC